MGMGERNLGRSEGLVWVTYDGIPALDAPAEGDCEVWGELAGSDERLRVDGVFWGHID